MLQVSTRIVCTSVNQEPVGVDGFQYDLNYPQL